MGDKQNNLKKKGQFYMVNIICGKKNVNFGSL